MPITEAYIAEIERKINEGGNGDVDRMELTLLMAIYKKVTCLEERQDKNITFRLGEALREHKGLYVFIGFIMWLTLIFFPQLLVQLLGYDHILAP